MPSIKEEQYSVVVIPQEAWENIIKTLDELKDKVERLMAQKEDEWLDSKTACEYLGVSMRQFQKYRDERRIAFSQFGRKVYVKRSDIDDFLDKHRIRAGVSKTTKNYTILKKSSCFV